MRKSKSVHACARVLGGIVLLLLAHPAHAADVYLPAGGDLQAALDAAQAGDTIYLEPGATFTGNFKLPAHAGSSYITVRSAAGSALLPAPGARISPAYAAYLPKITSPNSMPALRTGQGAAYWRLALLELGPNANTSDDIVELGDGSAAQFDLSQVPHHLVVDRVYVHGDPKNGHKRGIALNAANVTIVNSYISDIKAVGIDAQAIGGWNGPGPYLIENNYLEASTEVVMFGGDDPKIPGISATDVVVRGNTLRRPLEWRNPILPPPAAVNALAATGGSLTAGTYAYRVVARRYVNSTPVKSAASTEATVTVAAGGRAVISWNGVDDATEYLVYGRTPGAQKVYWRVTATTFTDDGTGAGVAGTPPATGTVWQVKNLFELKNARHVQVDHNVMENNWAQAQAGTAVLFTPRNQYGNCTWCVVEDVTFEYNVVRGIGAGIQVLGYDNNNPSQQTNGIRIRNNEFSDMNKVAWGGNGYFATITGGPRDITFDHNTIVSPSGGGVISVGGDAVFGLVFTNNVARHNSYGVSGTGQGTGNNAIGYYFPDAVFTRNVLAGGKASNYPAGNLFPTVTDFQLHFSDYDGGNFALVPGTDWANAATDGRDLGADESGLQNAPASPVDSPHVMTTAIPSTTEGLAYAAPLTATGGVLPYRWAVTAGALPAGVMLDPLTGGLSGTSITAGDYTFTAQVTDTMDAAASMPLTLRVIPAVTISTTALAAGTATLPYAQAFGATGGLGTYMWALTGGTLPPGVTFTADGLLAGTPAAAGRYVFEVTAFDAADAARRSAQSFTFTVLPPPNQPPSVGITSPVAGTTVLVGTAVSLAALASDSDGSVQRVDFYVNGSYAGGGAPGVVVPWTAPGRGTYAVTVVATDDRGASTTSQPIVITAVGDVVLYASQAAKMAGNYQLIADATAAGGYALWNPDLGAAKVSSASAAPTSYAEFTFYAEAGRPYHLWVRGKAQRNSWANDSAFVQFSGVGNARIGTTASVIVNLEDDVNAGVAGWGWQDNGYGTSVFGDDIVFETTGVQTLRIQPREDGLNIDQIVLSPDRYVTAAPGALKNDGTILPR
jgi:hypothetical protein